MPNFEHETRLDFDDVLIKPRRSTLESRSQVSVTRNFTFRNSGANYTGIPIIASNMDTVGTFEMAVAMSKENLFTTIHKHYTLEQWLEFGKQHKEVLNNVAVSCGISETDLNKAQKIISELEKQLGVSVKYICIDVANGYAQSFVDCVKKTRATHQKTTIIAGNVVTPEMVSELILSGADIVKVGIGPGSVCTTRKKTGVGYPQLSAVVQCAEAAHNLGAHIISDGGCAVPGDICKAFGAGADFVMLGGMLAGHDQCPGAVEGDVASNKAYKIFYGMSSKLAQEKYNAGLASYRASEGKVVKVPYRGDVTATISDILGGLRSTCTYTGSVELSELPKNTTFIRVLRQLNEVYSSRELT